MFANQNVSASEVLSTRDMNVRPGRDVTEIVGTFLTVAEAVVAHWVEYSTQWATTASATVRNVPTISVTSRPGLTFISRVLSTSLALTF